MNESNIEALFITLLITLLVLGVEENDIQYLKESIESKEECLLYFNECFISSEDKTIVVMYDYIEISLGPKFKRTIISDYF
jgi:hypothetical protein